MAIIAEHLNLSKYYDVLILFNQSRKTNITTV